MSSSRTLRARGALLKNAPLPHKTAGLNWKANSTTDLGLMARSPLALMGLIGKAWPDRHSMLRWVIYQIDAACKYATGLGVADRDLGDLPRKLVANKADKSPPLVQAVYYLERGYLETYLLTLQSACAELPEPRPLRVALVVPLCVSLQKRGNFGLWPS